MGATESRYGGMSFRESGVGGHFPFDAQEEGATDSYPARMSGREGGQKRGDAHIVSAPSHPVSVPLRRGGRPARG